MRGALAGITGLATVAIARVALAQTAPQPPASPPAPPPPPPPAAHEAAAAAAPLTPVPAPTPSEVRYRRMQVDVETTRPNAVLERRVTVKESNGAWLIIPTHEEEASWEQVCVAPCRGADLDRYSTYRVAKANHISGSHPFTLPQGGEAVHLRIDAGNQMAHRAGQTMAGVGGAALLVGLSLIVAAPSIESSSREHDYRVAGWVTGGAGLALLAVGLPLAILTRTTVYADNEQRVAKEPPKPGFIGNGFTF